MPSGKQMYDSGISVVHGEAGTALPFSFVTFPGVVVNWGTVGLTLNSNQVLEWADLQCWRISIRPKTSARIVDLAWQVTVIPSGFVLGYQYPYIPYSSGGLGHERKI